jgi:tetratricopeptide (TPR) repeat protein
MPLLVLATTRPSINDRHPAWLARAARSTLIQLVSLDDEAIRTLLAAALPSASDAFIAAVLERAAGSPLYAEQLAALARDRGSEGTIVDEAAVPPTIRALLGARIDGLPADLKPPLLDASVMGRVFWTGAVAMIGNGAREAVGSTLEDLASRELTRHQTPSSMVDEDEYGFWHALLRDVAYSFLPRAARLAKHRVAAAWISDHSRGSLGDLAEIVADHLRRAMELATAMDDEELPAIRSELADALLAAASHTLAMEPARAASQADEAMALVESGDRRQSSALSLRGRARLSTGEYNEAIAALDAAAEWHAAHGDDLAVAELALVRSRARFNAGDAVTAQRIRDEARPILEANPGPGLVELVSDDVYREAATSNLEGVKSAASSAFALAEQLGLPRPYRAVGGLGLALLEARDPRGEDLLHEGVELAMAAGDTRSALSMLGNRAAMIGEYVDANVSIEASDEAIAFAKRYGLGDGNVRGLRFDLLEVAGRWDEVLAEGAAIRADAIARGDAWTELMARAQICIVEAQRGELTLPPADYMAEARAVGMQPGIGGGMNAMTALVKGDREAARRSVVETVAAIAEGRWIFSALELVRVALALGDIDLARQVLAKAMPEAGPNSRNALTRLATALVQEAEGDLAGANQRFTDANAFFETLAWPGTQVIALAGRGRTRYGLGEREAGLADLAAAMETASRLRMRPFLAEIDAFLAATAAGAGSGAIPTRA